MAQPVQRSLKQALTVGFVCDDLHLTHAFLTALSASYQGLWVFENVLDRLDEQEDRSDEIAKAERVLETVEGWWQALAAGEPVVCLHERPVLTGEASRAWRLLQVAEARLRALIAELTDSSDLEPLLEDPLKRHVRAAALCECAHAQRVGVASVIRFAEIRGDNREAFRYRQRLLSCRSAIDEAEQLVAQLHEAEPEPSATLVARLLDASLLLPAHVAQRVVDIGSAFALYTGVFDYSDAGIPDPQASAWAEAGFDARTAGRWFAAGFSPRKAQAWRLAGTQDPLIAADFMWRGFTPEEAAAWLRRYIGGRRAAAWAAAGYGPDDTREWIVLGVRDPDQLATLPTSDRVM